MDKHIIEDFDKKTNYLPPRLEARSAFDEPNSGIPCNSGFMLSASKARRKLLGILETASGT
jgi:hypothetical protein